MANNYDSGVPVWVYHIDIDTKENLALPQLLKGLIGQHYSVSKGDFQDYSFVKSDAETSGTFNEQPHTVRMYYRKKKWAEVEDVSMYLKLFAPTPVFDSVDGFQRGTTYPGGMVLRTFKRVATTGGKFWYEIGPDQWILYHQMEIVDNPFDQPQSDADEGETEAIEKMDLVAAKIDYIPNAMIQVYDRPYGKIVNELEHNTEVQLSGKLTDDNGVTWYEVEDKGFVNGTYVKIK